MVDRYMVSALDGNFHSYGSWSARGYLLQRVVEVHWLARRELDVWVRRDERDGRTLASAMD